VGRKRHPWIISGTHGEGTTLGRESRCEDGGHGAATRSDGGLASTTPKRLLLVWTTVVAVATAFATAAASTVAAVTTHACRPPRDAPPCPFRARRLLAAPRRLPGLDPLTAACVGCDPGRGSCSAD